MRRRTGTCSTRCSRPRRTSGPTPYPRRLVREPRPLPARGVVRAVRAVWPERLPLFVRISATPTGPTAGWDLEQSREARGALEERWRRPGGRVERRARPGQGDGRAWLPDTVRRGHSSARGRRGQRGRDDHLPRAGRPHHPHRASRRRVTRPRDAPRPVLAASCRAADARAWKLEGRCSIRSRVVTAVSDRPTAGTARPTSRRTRAEGARAREVTDVAAAIEGQPRPGRMASPRRGRRRLRTPRSRRS